PLTATEGGEPARALREVRDDRNDLAKGDRSILIIEDDSKFNAILQGLAHEQGFKAIIAEDGKTGLYFADYYHPSAVILDLNLPDMSGEELLTTIKNEESLHGLPVIVYTGKDLSYQEKVTLQSYAENIIIRGVNSLERLLDETTLFLHRVETSLCQTKREILHRIHDQRSPLKGKHILLVDDDMRNVFAISSILEDKGLTITICKNGREALQALDEHPTARLVLMDMMMPEMDGYQAMGEIRKQKRFEKLPIIAITAKAMMGDRCKCIEAGASDYLAKPIDRDKLLSMMRVWLY
ncbi:MAG: histidine kinase, partial [uncultured bacterium]